MSDQESPNPYRAPQVGEVAAERSDYYVDYPYLVVKSGVRLPLRCVITNTPASVYLSTKLQYPTKWYQVSIGSRRCQIDWAVDDGIRRRQRLRSFSHGLAAIGTFAMAFTPPLMFNFGSAAAWLFIVPVVLFCFGLSVYFRSKSLPIPYVEKYRRGFFWIAGLGPEFLASMQEEQSSDYC